MKLTIESVEAREMRLAQPHDWFAWFPVRINPHDVRWLETVTRSGVWLWMGRSWGYVWAWTYVAKEPTHA